MLESLYEQVRSFDWEAYGTTEQYAFDLPEKDYVEYRRAQELQDALSCCLQGARFQKVFVSAVDYADEFRRYYEDLGFDFTLG